MGIAGIAQPANAHVLQFSNPVSVTAGSLHNIHLEVIDQTFEGNVRLIYGN